MNKNVNREVGVSRRGFVAEEKGEVIASAETFNGLTKKEGVGKLFGDKTLLIRHVVPEGTFRIY